MTAEQAKEISDEFRHRRKIDFEYFNGLSKEKTQRIEEHITYWENCIRIAARDGKYQIRDLKLPDRDPTYEIYNTCGQIMKDRGFNVRSTTNAKEHDYCGNRECVIISWGDK